MLGNPKHNYMYIFIGLSGLFRKKTVYNLGTRILPLKSADGLVVTTLRAVKTLLDPTTQAVKQQL